jgi:hypothetical protein
VGGRLDGGGELKAPPRYGYDGAGAEQLPQGEYLNMQIALLDRNAGPDPIEKVALGDHRGTALDQRQQDVESACADPGRPTVDQQLAPAWIDHEAFVPIFRFAGGHRLRLQRARPSIKGL